MQKFQRDVIRLARLMGVTGIWWDLDRRHPRMHGTANGRMFWISTSCSPSSPVALNHVRRQLEKVVRQSATAEV